MKEITLGKYGQKVLKAFHLLFISLTIGSLFVIIFILISVKPEIEPVKLEFMNFVNLKVFSYIYTFAFLALLLTSVIYATLTRWGFFRYGWVTIKWITAIILYLLTMLWITPSINGLAAISDAGFPPDTRNINYTDLRAHALLFTIITFIILFAVILISTLKPWKKFRRQPRTRVVNILLTAVIIFGIFSAINQYIQLADFRNMAISDTDLAGIRDGYYEGSYEKAGGPYTVKVEIEDNKIIDIEMLQNRKSRYAQYAELVLEKIKEEQSINVDAVSGATTTSKCILKAVENALNPSN